MKKKLLFLLSFVLIGNSFAQSNETIINKLKQIFPLYFDNIDGKKYAITKDLYTNFLFRNDGGIENVEAVGYIEDYKGMDFFITHTDYSFEGTDEEDMYNPTDYSRMYIAKDGKFIDNGDNLIFINYNGYNLINDEQPYIQRNYTQDEAIVYSLDYCINQDTTISFFVNTAEYSLLTGFDSSFNKDFSINCDITEKGQFIVKKINDIILDSPLFNSKITNDQFQNVPTKNNPYNLFGSSSHVNFQYLFPDKELNFYLSENNDPVFNFFHKGVFVSGFTKNDMLSNQSEIKQRVKILDYPVRIRIDNNVILLDIDGVFKQYFKDE